MSDIHFEAAGVYGYGLVARFEVDLNGFAPAPLFASTCVIRSRVERNRSYDDVVMARKSRDAIGLVMRIVAIGVVTLGSGKFSGFLTSLDHVNRVGVYAQDAAAYHA